MKNIFYKIVILARFWATLFSYFSQNGPKIFSGTGVVLSGTPTADSGIGRQDLILPGSDSNKIRSGSRNRASDNVRLINLIWVSFIVESKLSVRPPLPSGHS